MFWSQISHSLQFYNHLIFDYHIRDIVSNYLAFIKHIDWFLAFTPHATFCQLFIERITIYSLQKSKTQFSMNFLSRTNNLTRIFVFKQHDSC